MRTPTENPSPLQVAVLISGEGRTLKNFIDLNAAGNLPIDIRIVISSSSTAGGLAHASAAELPLLICRRKACPSDEEFSQRIFAACREAQVEYVLMAGFMKFLPIPPDFENRVINIHPSLIPAFCGQGLYGHHVHQAILDYGAKVSGCTVHFVDNQYDHGPIIWQQPTPVFSEDTADTLANRVFDLETEAYPHVIRLLAARKLKVLGRKVSLLSAPQKD